MRCGGSSLRRAPDIDEYAETMVVIEAAVSAAFSGSACTGGVVADWGLYPVDYWEMLYLCAKVWDVRPAGSQAWAAVRAVVG